MFESLKDIRHICAVITPFCSDGTFVDYHMHHQHLKFLKETGVEAIVSLGTTGESPTVSFREHVEMIKAVVKSSPLPVIAGAGGNSTAEAVLLTQEAEKAGAIAVLSVAPYYNRPTQRGLLEHYIKICEATELPVIAYNVPTRTGVNLEVDTILRLRDLCGNFYGIKEASNNLSAVQKYVLEDIPVYCGEDALNAVMLFLGAQGVISVLSNFAGRIISSLIRAIEANDINLIRAINNTITDLTRAAFIETNPIPTKFICSKLRFCENLLRLPLTTLSEGNEEIVMRLVGRHIHFPER